MAFSFLRDSEIRPSEKSSQTAPCFLKVDQNADLAALLIGDELDSGHTLFSFR
jgi:hypothetical protein